MRIVSSQYRFSYKIRKIATHKATRYTLALLLVTTAGVIVYSYQMSAGAASLPELPDPLSNPAITDEDMRSALSDDSSKKVAIESLNTRFDYWNNKPVSRLTTVTGTMWMQNKSKDSLPANKTHENDPYFFNAPLKLVFEKWGEVTGNTIEPISIASAPTFTGYLSDFKRDVLGLREGAELKFVMEKGQ